MKDYPLHPEQTHAEPLYSTIPLEEYENIMDEIKALRASNKMMRMELEKRGAIVVPMSSELRKFEKEWAESEMKNPSPIVPLKETL